VTKHAVLAGRGIAVMPFYPVRNAVEAGLAEVVLDDVTLAPIPVHAVSLVGSRTPSRVRWLVELLAQRLKKEVHLKRGPHPTVPHAPEQDHSAAAPRLVRVPRAARRARRLEPQP
jgi:hypothetical protein